MMTVGESFRVQKAVLSNWVNFKVGPRFVFVGDLFVDLGDGAILKHLLEVVTGEDLEAYATSTRPAQESQRQQGGSAGPSRKGFFFEANLNSKGPSSSSSSRSSSVDGDGGMNGDDRQQQQQGAPPIAVAGPSQKNRLFGFVLRSNSSSSSSSSSSNNNSNSGNGEARGDEEDEVKEEGVRGSADSGGRRRLTRAEQLHNMSVLFQFMRDRKVLPPSSPPSSPSSSSSSSSSPSSTHGEEEEVCTLERGMNKLCRFPLYLVLAVDIVKTRGGCLPCNIRALTLL